jgi:PIN domain
MIRELGSVLLRPKLAAYASISESARFLTELARVVEPVPITGRVELCRDPRDDKLLELALAGRADFLLTGDADLLALHPFRGTAILDGAFAWLKMYEESSLVLVWMNEHARYDRLRGDPRFPAAQEYRVQGTDVDFRARFRVTRPGLVSPAASP